VEGGAGGVTVEKSSRIDESFVKVVLAVDVPVSNHLREIERERGRERKRG